MRQKTINNKILYDELTNQNILKINIYIRRRFYFLLDSLISNYHNNK